MGGVYRAKISQPSAKRWSQLGSASSRTRSPVADAGDGSFFHKSRGLMASAGKHWEKAQRRVIGRFGKGKYLSLLGELDRLAQCARGQSTTRT
jgi:hypothetical protein